MTRINVGIDPSELPDKLLIAEHREITRIPNAVHAKRAKMINLPKTFTLGKGHVKFFYDKMFYLEKRYKNLYAECRRRGFNVTDKKSAFYNLPEKCLHDYIPTMRDRQLIIERIQSKGFQLLETV